MDERDERESRDARGLPDNLTADIAALAAMMTEHGLHQVDLEANGIKVSLTSGITVPASAMTVVTTNGTGPAGANALAATAAEDANPKTYDFRSPMIGTFYAAPGPNEESFVRVGDRVTVGQTVAIVEAMKINNEIQVDRNGTLEEIYVSNGQPVEYNQRLFRLALG